MHPPRGSAVLQAVLWDVDGTIAETERDGHRVAFNLAFAAHGLSWQWSEAQYGQLLQITGGRERLLHDLASRPAAPARLAERETLARSVHARKNEIYADIVRNGRIPFRAGVRDLMLECRAARVRMAIATTTSRANVVALLQAALGQDWAQWFAVMVCGEDVTRKKPDPEVYLRVLEALHLSADSAVAIEDSPAGAAAARSAGLPVILTRSVYFADEADTPATATGPGLDDIAGWRPAVRGPPARRRRVRLSDLSNWCYSSSVNSD